MPHKINLKHCLDTDDNTPYHLSNPYPIADSKTIECLASY